MANTATQLLKPDMTGSLFWALPLSWPINWSVLLILPPKYISNKPISLHIKTLNSSHQLTSQNSTSGTWYLLRLPPGSPFHPFVTQELVTLIAGLHTLHLPHLTSLLSVPQIHQVHFYPGTFVLHILSAWNACSSNFFMPRSFLSFSYHLNYPLCREPFLAYPNWKSRDIYFEIIASSMYAPFATIILKRKKNKG
jgi:hypothetical protein